MKTYSYTIHLEPAEEGGFIVTVPALPAVVTQGESYEEALAMAEDAIRLYLDTLIEDGEAIPIEEPIYRPLDARVTVEAAASV